jgi:hypothetical protein
MPINSTARDGTSSHRRIRSLLDSFVNIYGWLLESVTVFIISSDLIQ